MGRPTARGGGPLKGKAGSGIEAAAVRLLAGREHARVELARKLAAKGHDHAEVDAVLDDLARRKLLSDDRFTEQYIATRVRKGYGPLRIRAELRERGVDPALVTARLEAGGHDWAGLLQDVRAGKFGAGRPADRREAARQARFLVQRGFPENLVRDLLLGD